MNLSISNIAWGEKDDEKIYQKMQACHFQFLEIAPTRWVTKNPYSNENTEKAKMIIQNIKERYEIEICSMQSILYGVKERLFYDNQEREVLKRKIKKAMCYASKIGCKNLVFGSPKNRNMKENTQYEHGISFFRELAEYAEEKNVFLSIEATPIIYGANYINNTQEALKLVKEVQKKHFGINYDLGTVIQNDESLDFLKYNLECVNHIHISEPHLQIIQKRKLHKELFEILKKFDYKNVVSIEMKKIENIERIYNVLEYISIISL